MISWTFLAVLVLLCAFWERLLGLVVSRLVKVYLGYDITAKWISVCPAVLGSGDATEITLWGVKWNNPPGYKQPLLLQLRQLSIKVELVSVVEALRYTHTRAHAARTCAYACTSIRTGNLTLAYPPTYVGPRAAYRFSLKKC